METYWDRGTREYSVISAFGTHGTRECSVTSALGSRGTRECSATSAVGTRGTREYSAISAFKISQLMKRARVPTSSDSVPRLPTSSDTYVKSVMGCRPYIPNGRVSDAIVWFFKNVQLWRCSWDIIFLVQVFITSIENL